MFNLASQNGPSFDSCSVGSWCASCVLHAEHQMFPRASFELIFLELCDPICERLSVCHHTLIERNAQRFKTLMLQTRKVQDDLVSFLCCARKGSSFAEIHQKSTWFEIMMRASTTFVLFWCWWCEGYMWSGQDITYSKLQYKSSSHHVNHHYSVQGLFRISLTCMLAEVENNTVTLP